MFWVRSWGPQGEERARAQALAFSVSGPKSVDDALTTDVDSNFLSTTRPERQAVVDHFTGLGVDVLGRGQSSTRGLKGAPGP